MTHLVNSNLHDKDAAEQAHRDAINRQAVLTMFAEEGNHILNLFKLKYMGEISESDFDSKILELERYYRRRKVIDLAKILIDSDPHEHLGFGA